MNFNQSVNNSSPEIGVFMLKQVGFIKTSMISYFIDRNFVNLKNDQILSIVFVEEILNYIRFLSLKTQKLWIICKTLHKNIKK